MKTYLGRYFIKGSAFVQLILLALSWETAGYGCTTKFQLKYTMTIFF